jgi:type IV secretory pathway TraG/TraD family ATPase VirD4/uncharacterized protein YjiK
MTMRIATAEWANPAEVEERYLYSDGTVWLGRSASEHQVSIGYLDDRHVCLVSGSRGGKGTSFIIPSLIEWPGSAVLVDPKGENATVTAARRGGGSPHCKGLGQSVKVLDPFKAAQVDDALRGRFNPLDALNPANEETIDEAGRIADAVVVIHESNDPFWDESARAMVKGLILHVLTAPEYEGRRNLVTVRKLIMRGDWEAVEALRGAGESDIPPAHGLLWTGLANNPVFDGLVAGIGDSFTNMLLNSPKQFESVLQVANRNTEFIDSPAMQRCLGASDFQLSELKTRPEGLSLYLCLPQRYMSTHYRWLRMMIALIVTEMEKVRGQPVSGHPVLMILDEFAGMKRLEIIESAVAQIAGAGVKMLFVLQSLEQLKAVYKDNWETFLANSGLKIFFNVEDYFSREYVSKLVGETEVVREVRSESDTTSESESLSHSTSRSQSQSRGRSSSAGTSETDGTNSSENTGKSWGSNTSKGRSWNRNWDPGGFLGHAWTGGSRGQSESRGHSVTQSKGRSHGVSHGTSRSRTDGTSETLGTSTSDTEGTTHGTSQSRTAGSSETIQKRALVTPDEIGLLFARIDDRAHHGYPGLVLVVISGARPLALRRVNYYEDLQFAGLFDPHPDHPLIEPKILTVEASAMGRTLVFFESGIDLRIAGWSVAEGQMVAAGDPLAAIVTEKGKPAAQIRAPRAGLIAAVQGNGSPIPAGPLFSIRYFEDGAPVADPFEEFREFCNKIDGLMAAKRRELLAKRSSARLAVLASGFVAALVLLAMIISQSAPVGMMLMLIGFGGVAIWKGIAISGLEAELRKYAGIPAPAPAPITPATDRVQEAQPEPAEPQPVPVAAKQEAEGAQPVSADTGTAEMQTPEEVVPPVPDSAPPVLADTGPPETRTPEEVIPPPADRAELPAEQPVIPSQSEAGPTSEKRRRPLVEVVVLAGILMLVAIVATVIIRDQSIEDQPPDSGVLAQKPATLARGDKEVLSLAFSPDGRMLAEGSYDDPTIRLWDVATHKELAPLKGHTNTVNSVAFSPDGRLLASASDDYKAKLWDVAARTELRTLTSGQRGAVALVAYSPDGRLVASPDERNTIKLWDVATGNEVGALVGHQRAVWGAENPGLVRAVAFSPDGRMLAEGSQDKTINLWDVATRTKLRTLRGHGMPILSLAFSPDSRLLASASQDRTAMLWNTSGGTALRTFSGYHYEVNSVAFSPDGRVLAAASQDSKIKLWDVSTGGEVGAFTSKDIGLFGPVLAFSADGSLAAGLGKTIVVWEKMTGAR